MRTTHHIASLRMLARTAMLCLSFAFAAQLSAQQFRYGVQAGANHNSLVFVEKGKFGYEAGLFAEYQFQPMGGLFVDAGLSFVKTGWETTLMSKGGQSYHQMHPAYLQLPLHVGYRLPLSKHFAVRLAAGPYFAYGIGGKGSVGGIACAGNIFGLPSMPCPPLRRTEELNNVFKDELRRFDWGIDVALSAELGRHWRVTLSHKWGLRRVIDTHNDWWTLAGNGFAKNRILSLGIGYAF